MVDPGMVERATNMPRTWLKSMPVTLALAVNGVFLYGGWHRIAYVTAFVSMSLANLANASATLLAEGQKSRTLRLAVTPLVLVMIVALAFTLAFQTGWLS